MKLLGLLSHFIMIDMCICCTVQYILYSMCVCIHIMQVSGDIIKRCYQKIVLDDLFDGHVEKSKAALQVNPPPPPSLSLSTPFTHTLSLSLSPGEHQLLPAVEGDL